ncbi:hypothetical protein Tco_0427381 [Tanacetum coccineum]
MRALGAAEKDTHVLLGILKYPEQTYVRTLAVSYLLYEAWAHMCIYELKPDRAPAPSEYNVEHINTLIAQASPFLRFPEEFLCWVGISRNYLLNKRMLIPAFEYENGEASGSTFLMDLNAFIRTADPRKVRIVERPRAENERPIVTVAKHRTVTLLPTSVVRSSGELSASVEREFVGDASVGDGGDQGFDSAVGQENVEPSVAGKKRVIYDSEGLPVASHPPKRLRADYGTAGGSVTGGKSLSALNRLLQDSRLTVEQGVPALPTLPFITSSWTASPLEEGGRSLLTRDWPLLGEPHSPSARFVVLSDSSHHSSANSAGPEVDSLAKSAAPVMIEAITVSTTSFYKGRSGSVFSGFDVRRSSLRKETVWTAGSEEIYVPEWTVTKGHVHFLRGVFHGSEDWADAQFLTPIFKWIITELLSIV